MKDQSNQFTPDTCAMREQTAGELWAIMERREEENQFVNEQVTAMVNHYRDQGEQDAARIHVLETALRDSNSAMDCIRNGLHYMEGEWGPLFQAMIERQDMLKTLLDQVRMKAVLLRRESDDKHTVDVASAIVELTGKMAAVLLNDYGQGEQGKRKPKEDTLYYCPTCKRHVHPEDLVWDSAGEKMYHLVSRDPIARCSEPVEVRGIDKDPPKAPRDVRRWMEELDNELTKRGVRRTNEDTRIIGESYELKCTPEDVAERLAKAAYQKAGGSSSI